MQHPYEYSNWADQYFAQKGANTAYIVENMLVIGGWFNHPHRVAQPDNAAPRNVRREAAVAAHGIVTAGA